MAASLGHLASARTVAARDQKGLAAVLPQAGRRRDWLPQLPQWIDPLSLAVALKTCVGLVIGVTIALWLGWSATGVGFACIMLQTAYLGRTLGRSILRMAGALLGALLAMAFVATFIQERATLIAAYALLTGLIIYIEQISEHPYALLFVLLSVGLITFTTINDPQDAFSEAVSWVSGNALGITIVLFMHGVLWPHTGESSFEQQLATFLQGLSRLFTLKMATMPLTEEEHAEPREQAMAEIRELESRLISALAPLRLALGIAVRDTGRFTRFEAAYVDLMERLQSLTSVLMAYGDSLRIWRGTPLAATVIPKAAAPQAVRSALQAQFDDLAAACTCPRDGIDQVEGQETPQAIAASIETIRQQLRAQQHSVLEVAAFDAVSEKALDLSQSIAEVRQALGTVERPRRQVARAQQAQVDPITQIQSVGLRLRKAAIGMVAVVAASLLWIYLDWPDPGSLMVYVLLPVALNAMVPTFPLKGALKSLFLGPAIGALLYFVIMPPLTDMWQLAPLVVLCLLPTTYLTNSPNPSTMIFGLLSSLWAFLLIDISEGQAYAFSTFSNTLLGIVGGTGIGLATLAFFNPPLPERQVKIYARTFLQHCAGAIERLHVGAAGTGAGDPIAASRAEALELVGLCELWARHLDPDRHPAEERATVGAMIAAMRAVAFRLEALERAHQRHPNESLIAAACADCRKAASAALGALRQTLVVGGPTAGVPLAAAADAFRAALEPLHSAAHAEDNIQRSLHEALTLTGYHTALIDAIDECRRHADAIDWRQWDLAYF
jgi:hypothetical protein